jgi:enamine deaminase RidA (YjgF/YER057c/UK114 family)
VRRVSVSIRTAPGIQGYRIFKKLEGGGRVMNIECGGVFCVADNGTLDLEKGLPEVPRGQVFSLMGWGASDQLKNRGAAGRECDTPQMWLCGGEGAFPPVFQRFMLDGAQTRLITRRGCTVGVCYEDAHAEYCFLTGILPPDLTASREAQTTGVFEGIEDALRDAGMIFGHVVRTWLYMDDILDWYESFNRARDEFFRSRRLYDGLVPASTGIGSANIYGAAFTACAIAVRPKSPATCVIPVASPLQCAALEYGSSFSRAVEISTPDCRSLLISGTASIEPGGKTAHVGDVERQIRLTMDVVGGILESRDMDWSDATRAIMYLKKPEYLKPWQVWLQKNGLADLPLINVQADVCRDDLLVELELDAVKRA